MVKRKSLIQWFIILILLGTVLYLINPYNVFGNVKPWDIKYIGNEMKYSIKNFRFKADSLADIPKCLDCNVIWLSLEGLRADRLGAYGYELDTSPNIDRLTEESIVFKETFINSLDPGSSFTSAFRSFYPRQTNSPTGNKFSDYKSILGTLKRNGYKTTWSGYSDIRGINFSRFFGTGVDSFYDPIFTRRNRFDNKIFSEILEEGGKFFWGVYLTTISGPQIYPGEFSYEFSDPNYVGKLPKNFNESDEMMFFGIMEEYKKYPKALLKKIEDAPLTLDQKKTLLESLESGDLAKYSELRRNGSVPRIIFKNVEIGRPKESRYSFVIDGNSTKEDLAQFSGSYDNGVFYVDYLLSVFFNELKKHDLWENTIIIINSNQGKELYEQRRFNNLNFYDNVIHVPLIIKVPGLKQKIEFTGISQSVDISPTLKGLLNVESKARMDGKDLLREIPNEYVYGTLFDKGSYIRSKKWKYIRLGDGTEELYYLVSDPFEQSNLIEEGGIILNKFKQTMKKELMLWETNLN